MRKLEKKIAVVTGASRGIGLAIVESLAQVGANVVACSSKPNEVCETAYQNIEKKYNVSIYPVFFDMSDETSVKEGMREIKKLNQSIDILVNNAGIAHMSLLPFTKTSDMHRVFQINFFSQYLIIQELIGLLKKSPYPSIINIASVAGIDGGVGVSVYGASKASMILLTKVLSQELAQLKIRVNAVAPGMINTKLATQMGEKAIDNTVSKTAVGRIGMPLDVANVVAFLASEESSYINGQVIRVDGGIN